MDSKPNFVIQELEVATRWVHQVADDTLIAYLPGFRKDQLKVQVSTGGNLRISGECPIGVDKIGPFLKEFPIPSNCDKSKIRANFSGGMLRVKFPKLIIQADKNQPNTSAESEQKPTAKGKNDAVQQAPPMAAPRSPSPPADDAALKRNDTVQQAPPRPPTAAVEKRIRDEEKKKNIAANGSHGDPQDVAEKEDLTPKEFDSIENYQTRIRMNKGKDNPRKIMNIVLAVLSVVVLIVYLRNVIMNYHN